MIATNYISKKCLEHKISMSYNTCFRGSKRFNKEVASCWPQEKNFYKGCIRTFVLSHCGKYL